jgi:hypothetical protein
MVIKVLRHTPPTVNGELRTVNRCPNWENRSAFAVHRWAAHDNQRRTIAKDRENLENAGRGFMKKTKGVAATGIKIKRPPRAQISEKEALQRMEKLSERREQFIAFVRAGQN